MSNALQAFNDSSVGVVVGTALHTLGAIGFLGGLIGYIAWHRHLRRGHHHANALAMATFLTYLAIVVNLLGGFMRTYETGHPHLTQFATSAWVRAIAIKHLFLFTGMGAAVYLFEVVAPRHLRAHREQRLAQVSTTGHSIGVLLVVLGIVVSAILGAVSSVLPVGAAVQETPQPPLADAYHNVTGQLLSTAVAPATVGGDFVVPANRTDLAVLLTWTPAQGNLHLELTDPTGQAVLVRDGSAGELEASLGSAPLAGAWRFVLSSPDPVVNVQWSLVVHMPAGAAHGH